MYLSNASFPMIPGPPSVAQGPGYVLPSKPGATGMGCCGLGDDSNTLNLPADDSTPLTTGAFAADPFDTSGIDVTETAAQANVEYGGSGYTFALNSSGQLVGTSIIAGNPPINLGVPQTAGMLSSLQAWFSSNGPLLAGLAAFGTLVLILGGKKR